MGKITEYVINDQSTADKYALSISDEQFQYTTSVAAVSSNPIFEDKVNAGTYWEFKIDDGQVLFSTTATSQDDALKLFDSVSGKTFQLFIGDGQFYYSEVPTAYPDVVSIMFSVLSPIVTTVSDRTATPGVVSITFTVPSPSVATQLAGLVSGISIRINFSSEMEKTLTFESLMDKAMVVESEMEKQIYKESNLVRS